MQSVRRPWTEQKRLGIERLWRDLAQRRNVVQDPEAAPVGRDREIAEVLLHGQPVDRRVRQVVLKREPLDPVVERHVKRVLGAKVEQPLPHRILPDAVRVVHWAARKRFRKRAPRFPVVFRLEHERVEIRHLMQVDGDYAAPGINREGSMLSTVPSGGSSPILEVTLVQCAPASRVICTWPSLVPAQINPFSIGDSPMGPTTSAYSPPSVYGLRPQRRRV